MSLSGSLNIGRPCEDATIAAVEAWRRRYAPRVLMEDLLAWNATSLTVECTLWPGGRLTVITTVRGRRQFDDETHVFRYVRTPQTGYRRVGSSLPSTIG